MHKRVVANSLWYVFISTAGLAGGGMSVIIVTSIILMVVCVVMKRRQTSKYRVNCIRMRTQLLTKYTMGGFASPKIASYLGHS